MLFRSCEWALATDVPDRIGARNRPFVGGRPRELASLAASLQGRVRRRARLALDVASGARRVARHSPIETPLRRAVEHVGEVVRDDGERALVLFTGEGDEAQPGALRVPIARDRAHAVRGLRRADTTGGCAEAEAAGAKPGGLRRGPDGPLTDPEEPS